MGRPLLAVPIFGDPDVGVGIALLVAPGPYRNFDGAIISDDFQVALKLGPPGLSGLLDSGSDFSEYEQHDGHSPVKNPPLQHDIHRIHHFNKEYQPGYHESLTKLHTGVEADSNKENKVNAREEQADELHRFCIDVTFSVKELVKRVGAGTWNTLPLPTQI